MLKNKKKALKDIVGLFISVLVCCVFGITLILTNVIETGFFGKLIQKDKNEGQYEYALSSTITNEEYDNGRNYLEYINADGVWDITRGETAEGTKIKVAIIDSGIDTDHPDFYDDEGKSIISSDSGRIYVPFGSNGSLTVLETIADTGKLSVVEDQYGHGTAVAGIIAAQANGIGIVGLAPEVELIIIKPMCSLNDEGLVVFDRQTTVASINYAVSLGVDVINLSLGSTPGDITAEVEYQKELNKAEEAGIIVVASAGNEGSNIPQYPAGNKYTIAVGACSADSYERASYSNYGAHIDVLSPGTVYSTDIGGIYSTRNGTSLSAPIVTSAAALFLAQNPDATPEDFRARLHASSKDYGEEGRDDYYGYGVLDLRSLLCAETANITYHFGISKIDDYVQLFLTNCVLSDVLSVRPYIDNDTIYYFVDWYYDQELTQVFEVEDYYTTIFDSNITLYAKWEEGTSENYCDEVFEFEEINGELYIIKFNSELYYHTVSAVNIPDTFNGKAIVSIGSYVFRDCHTMISIKLPNNLKNIGDYAFKDCSSLTSVEFPESLESLGIGAFAGCYRLEKIILNSVAINDLNPYNDTFAYVGKEAIGIKVIVGSTVTKIPSNLFNPSNNRANVPNISSIEFVDNSVCKIIGAYAFYCAVNIVDIKIPESVDLIDRYAFFGCDKLSDITIPTSVSQIKNFAFCFCPSVSNLVIDKNFTIVEEYAFDGISMWDVSGSANNIVIANIYKSLDGSETYTLVVSGTGKMRDFSSNENGSYHSYRSSIVRTIIGDGITEIGAYAFYKFTNMVSISIPESVSIFGQYVFYNCAHLETIDIPKNITELPDRAFYGCSSLTSVAIPKGVIGIGYYSFYDCVNLTNIILPEGLLRMGDAAFYKCTSLKSILIPNSVTSIGASVFSGCTSLTNVTISEGITEISSGMFYGCSNLQSIEIPESVININDRAFYNCSSLTSIEIPDSVTNIGNSAFYNCSSLTSIEIPEDVTSVGDSAFYYCSSLTSIEIPEGVTSVGDYAFYGCTSLKSVLIPESVTGIYYRAFFGCSNLSILFESKVLPEELGDSWNGTSVYYLSVKALVTNDMYIYFVNTDNLATILKYTGMATDLVIDTIDGYQVIEIANKAFYNCSSLTSIELPKGVTSIASLAFCNCSSLTSIKIPEGVTSIGDNAFSGCSNLTSIEIPESVKSIGNHAFSGCSNLTSIEIPESVTSIGSFAFYNCRSLKSVTFAENSQLTSISESAFDRCSSLASIKIPESVKSIGNSAFYNCGILMSIEIPDGVTSIASLAFFGCSNLSILFEAKVLPEELGNSWNGTSVYYLSVKALVTNDMYIYFVNTDNLATILKYTGIATDLVIDTIDGYQVIEIANSAFYNCRSLMSIELPDSVTNIGNSAFYFCSSLTSIEIPEGVTSIGSSAFSYCSSLTSIELPDSVTNIGNSAFSDCSSLTSIEIPKGVTSIGSSAFYNCRSLTNIVIPDSVTSIGRSVFSNCSNLSILFESKVLPEELGNSWNGTSEYYLGAKAFETNEVYNYFIDIDDYVTILKYKGAQSDLIVDTLGEYKVSNIAAASFAENTSLKNIVLSVGITSIGNNAFYSCSNLMSVTFVENSQLKSIGNYAFSGCSSLTSIEIPESVTSIGSSAFYNCSSLTSIEIPNGVTSIDYYTFYNCSSLASIEIPEGVTSIGNSAFYNCRSLTSIELPEGVTSIGDSAFYNCSSLTDIVIPNSVSSVGQQVFYSCCSLTSIVIPDSVTSIRYQAFYGCKNLTSIELSKHLSDIGQAAFYGCNLLETIVIPSTVTNIGANAFLNCGNLIIGLKSNILPATLGNSWNGTSEYYLGAKAFETNEVYNYFIDIDDYVTILKYKGAQSDLIVDTLGEYKVSNIAAASFAENTSLKNIVLSVGITSIGNNAFYSCSNLMSVTLPASLITIGNQAFYGCSNLASIVIPENVIDIGKEAFYNCSELTDIEIKGWTYINESSFYSVEGTIIFIKYAEASSSWSSNWDNGFLGTIVYGAEENYQPIYTEGLQFSLSGGEYLVSGYTGTDINIIIPEIYQGLKVAGIAPSAFSGCNKVTSIVIPKGVTTIGERAFYNCSKVTRIEIPNSVMSIGGRAFYCCSDLVNLVIPEGVTSLGYQTFYGCSDLVKVVIPQSVKSIGDYAFYNCSSLVSVEIPDGVLRIGFALFFGCSKLATIDIPDSVYYIDQYAFSDCSSLTSIKIPEGVAKIAYQAFRNCSKLTSIVIPDSVTNIDNYAFQYCRNLQNVKMSENITRIGVSAFEYCTKLQSIEIPAGVTSIGDSVFSSCDSLKFIIIYSSEIVKQINSDSSCGKICKNGASIAIPAELVEIGSYITTNYTIVKNILYNNRNYTLYSKHTHIFEEYTVISEYIQCNQDGCTRFVCSICGAYNDVVVLAHSKVQQDGQKPTCAEIGWNAYETCLNCDYTTYLEIPMLDHTYGEWGEIKAPTYEVAGEEQRLCTICGETETREISKLEATLDEEINFGHSCSFHNNLTMNYYVPTSDLTKYDSFYLNVEKVVYKNGVWTIETTCLQGELTSSGYKFVFTGIGAAEAGNEIRAALYAELNGVKYKSIVDVYSVKAYAYSRLEKSSDAEFKTLLVDMLNYCAAAQTYFGENTDNLVNADLTAEQRVLATQMDADVADTSSKIALEGASAKIVGKSIVFNSNIEVKFYMDLSEYEDLTGISLRVTYTDEVGKEHMTTITANKFVFDSSVGYYAVKLNNVNSSEMRSVMTVEIWLNETVISDTVYYSVETYVYNRLNKSSDEKFKVLLKELMKYSDSAKKYFY